MRFLLLFLFLFTSMVGIDAQRSSFRGKVTDHNDEPIKGVEFYIDMKRVKESTNKRGKYSLRHPESFKLITVYAPQYGFINWSYNREKKIDFIFPDDSEPMDRDAFMALGYQAPILTKEHDKNQYATYSNILEILDRRFQDVRVKNGKIIVGRMGVNSVTASDEPLILVNDVPTNVKTVETIPTADVKSIQVVSKGSESAAYGLRGMNGVILIKLKTAEDDG